MTADAIAALERFRMRLAAIKHVLAESEQQPGFDPGDPVRQRMCCRTALHATKELLDAIEPNNPHLAAPFDWLLVALDDVHKGLTAPLFVPVRGRGQPTLPNKVRVLRGKVAAVREYLFQEGYSRAKAAKYVFNGLGKEAVKRLHYQQNRPGADWKEVNWSTVSRWRGDEYKASQKLPEGEGFRRMQALLAAQVLPSDTVEFRADRQLAEISRAAMEFAYPRIAE